MRIDQPEIHRMLRKRPRHFTLTDAVIFIVAGCAMVFAVLVLTLLRPPL